jgi:hypothetical protein
MRNAGIGILVNVFIIGGLCAFCAPHGNEKVIECPTLMQSTIDVYEVRPRKDKRGVHLIADLLPFGRLWYEKAPGAIGYATHHTRSHDTVIRVYDEAGNVIETHEHAGDFKEW